jgi:hypothetical protein
MSVTKPHIFKHETWKRVNLLGLGPRLIKKNLLGRGLIKVENLQDILQG